jgi:hypothetical protein
MDGMLLYCKMERMLFQIMGAENEMQKQPDKHPANGRKNSRPTQIAKSESKKQETHYCLITNTLHAILASMVENQD